MTTAISIRNLSKRYIVEEDRASTLKEMVLRLVKPVARDEIEALKPLSLEVPQGQALGIIGQNGAGKSTLLKLIAGVTCPTTGSVEVNGSLMSLLEVGAGFQDDLSGIENIYLNGSILGLPEKRITELLPDIIAFSGLEDFIFTPVKHYSTGMEMRLGFSIAAHVEPDIIVLDENLAVGDIAFQAKCVAKLKDLKAKNKTIILVTHGLDIAELLCDRIVWLKEGAVAAVGQATDTVKRYEQALTSHHIREWNEDVRRQRQNLNLSGRFGSGDAIVSDFSIFGDDGKPRHVFVEDEPVTMAISYEARREIPNLNMEIGITREDGLSLFTFNAAAEGHKFHVQPGAGNARIVIDRLRLRPGRYLVDVALSPDNDPSVFFDIHMQLYHFRVEQKLPAQVTSAVHLPFDIEVKAL